MKVLVATRESQGERGWDVWQGGMEGELVRPLEGWLEESAEPLRIGLTGFVGLASGGVTTTARVADVPELRRRDYELMLRGSLSALEREVIRTDRYAGELARVAAGLRGTGVVERWDEWIGFRYEDGVLRPDITGIAVIDPAELEDIG